MRFILDTNIVIAALNDMHGVRKKLEKWQGNEIGIPTVVLAELYYGAEHSQRREENIAKVAGLRARFRTLAMTERIARRYGEVREALRGSGIVKSDFDLVVAVTALEHGATVVSDDGGLLDAAIDGLKSEDWLPPR